MHIVRRTLGGLGLVAILGSLTGCGDLVLHRATRVIEVNHVDAKPLVVTSENGSITVTRGQPPSVRITARLAALTAERLEQTQVVAERSADGTLAVRVSWPDRRQKNEGASFEIAIPSVRDLTLTTSNGKLHVCDTAGLAKLQTSNGSVHVENHAGNVEADSSNGSLLLDNVGGNVVARTSNGRVEIDGVSGLCDVSTSNGSVDIDLASTSSGPVTVHTNNGSVALEIGPAFVGEVSATTSNGRVTVDGGVTARIIEMGRNAARFAIGSGGSPSTLQTSNGSIRIKLENEAPRQQ